MTDTGLHHLRGLDRCAAPRPRRPLTLALVDAKVLYLASSPSTREPAPSSQTTPGATHSLMIDR